MDTVVHDMGYTGIRDSAYIVSFPYWYNRGAGGYPRKGDCKVEYKLSLYVCLLYTSDAADE